MLDGLVLPILDEMVPSGLRYGGHYLVEFEPGSLWYETSLTITARALRNGVRTEYHTFQHPPMEVRESLSRLGLDLQTLEREGVFRIWDTFTYLTDLGLAPEAQVGASHTWEIYKPSFFADLTDEVASIVKGGVSEGEKRWLHIDDNTSVLNRYLGESEIVDIWQTRLIPYARVRQTVSLVSIATGVASDQFYKHMESLSVGIIDLRTREERGGVEHYVRVRAMRGKTHDSRWRRLQMSGNGEVTLGPIAQESSPEFDLPVPGQDKVTQPTAPSPKPVQEIRFETERARGVFQQLAGAFVRDYMSRRLYVERAGWRSLMDIVRESSLPRSSVYGPRGRTGPVLTELERRGLIEARIFPEERGRGGAIIKVRVAYDNLIVRKFVEEVARGST